MDFDLPEDLRMLRDTAARFTEKELIPHERVAIRRESERGFTDLPLLPTELENSILEKARAVVDGSMAAELNWVAARDTAVLTLLYGSGLRASEAVGLRLEDIDWLIPHQANVRILEATAKRLKVPHERLIVTVDRHANTSAASVPLALDVAVRDGRIRPGHRVMLQGVGGGFTWGASLVEM